MSTVVSEASIGRAAAHSQGSTKRAPGGADEAASPFADLLDSCAASESEAPEGPADPAAAKAPADAKPQAEQPAPEVSVQAGVTADDADKIAAELVLAIALASQPATDTKEAKPVADGASKEPATKEAKTDTDAPLPQGDAAATPDNSQPLPTVPVLTATAAVAAPIPLPTEISAEPAPAPASDEIAVTVANAGPGTTPVGTADTEKASRSAEAIQTTLAAHPDKNKTLEAEKPTTTAAERTLDTPAAFRSASSAEAETTTRKTDAPKEPVSVSADNPAAKAPRGDIETPEPKAKMAAPQPALDTSANAPAPSASVQANAAPQQTIQTTAAQPASQNPVPVAGLAVEIAAHAQAGKNRFEIRLDPPELGRIDVRLDIGSDGQVTSHLRVERAETLDLLRRDAPVLERALQDAGLKTSDNGLQFSLRDQSSFAWQQQQDGEASSMARIVVPDETLPPVETQRSYGRLAGLGSGVDIRV